MTKNMQLDRLTRTDIIEYRGYRKNIKGDKFSLYISNYPSNAQYLRSRIGNPGLILAELCCSIGVTLEYLASGFKKVIGVDLDKDVVEICRKNLIDAGLINKVELVCGDVSDEKLLKSIVADIVIYDIPYWYPHIQQHQGSLISRNPPLKPLIAKIRKYITHKIIIFSPPELDYEHFSDQLGDCEYEQVFITGSHNRNQIYLGELIRTKGKTRVELN